MGRRGFGRCGLAGYLLLLAPLASGLGAADLPRPGDDATFRPTVMIRQAKGLGSGTIVGSVEGETLILTASHVVEESGPITIELFRFNLGLERVRAATGYPRKVEAEVVARDPDADLAILRVRGQLTWPFSARIARGEGSPAAGTRVTTIGYDKGVRLIAFPTRVRSVERVDLDKGGGFRSFLVTVDPPEVGRSGGGLYRADGALVGVCVGKVGPIEGRTMGLFSSLLNIKDLIRSDEDVAASLARAALKARSPAR